MEQYLSRVENVHCINDGQRIIQYDDGLDTVAFCEYCCTVVHVVADDGDEDAAVRCLNSVIRRGYIDV